MKKKNGQKRKKTMKTIIIRALFGIILLVLLLSQVAYSGPVKQKSPQATKIEETKKGHVRKSQKHRAYRPTERIRADQAVAFPVDI